MKHDATLWVGLIYFVDANGKSASSNATAYCHDPIQYDETVNAHLQRTGGTFLWSENISQIDYWTTQHGQICPSAQNVNQKNPVILFDHKPSGHTPDSDNDVILEFNEIKPIDPLDSQLGVQKQLVVQEPLRSVIFDQPRLEPRDFKLLNDTPGVVPPLNTYAILDASKLPFLLSSLLEGSGLEYHSLFQGDAQDDLGEYAPYIVKLEDGNDFTRKLFTTETAMGLWERNLGVFIRSRSSLVKLREHFRKFTRIRDANDKWYYFRFWDTAAWGSTYTAKQLLLHLAGIFTGPHSPVSFVIKLGGRGQFVAKLASSKSAPPVKYDQTLRHLFLQARLHHLEPQIQAPPQVTIGQKLDLLVNLFYQDIRKPTSLVTVAQASIDSQITPENLYAIVETIPSYKFDRTNRIIEKIQSNQLITEDKNEGKF